MRFGLHWMPTSMTPTTDLVYGGPGYPGKLFIRTSVTEFLKYVNSRAAIDIAPIVNHIVSRARDTVMYRRGTAQGQVVIKSNVPMATTLFPGSVDFAFKTILDRSGRIAFEAATKKYREEYKGSGNFGTPRDNTDILSNLDYRVFKIKDGWAARFGPRVNSPKTWAQELGLKPNIGAEKEVGDSTWPTM